MNTEQRLSVILVFVVVVTLVRLFALTRPLWQLAAGGTALVTGLWAAVMDWRGEEE